MQPLQDIEERTYMSRIQEVFKKQANQKSKAFIPFITCGYPDLDTTKKLVYALINAGADIIELGIPFSDPTAEGPVIMEADRVALENGIKISDIFDLVTEVRKDSDVPLVFMTYANVVFAYGIEEFAIKSREAGVDGIILPDIPWEEKEEFAPIFERYGMDFISLIAPTSDTRIEKIAKEAKGFLYLVSSLGVTGMREEFSTDIPSMVAAVKRVSDIPVAIGFGISDKVQAREFAILADGIIIGSAIVNLCGKENAVEAVGEFARGIKQNLYF